MNRRQNVIDAAVAILREGGPDALTSGSVAARLGVTQPAIYRHIRDMDELVQVASQTIVADLTETMMSALNAPETQWGDGTRLTRFADRVLELIEARASGFEIVDRWRYDTGELGAGLREILDAGTHGIADVLESQLRHSFHYHESFDDDTIRAQLFHASLIVDDVVIVARVIRRSANTQHPTNAARILGLRIFAGWYAYTIDMTHRCGLATPALGDDALRLPDLSPR